MIQPFFLVARTRRIALTVSAALLAPLAPAPAAGAVPAEAADRVSYILFAPGEHSTTMSGSMDDLRRAKALRAGLEGLLYFRSGGATYLVRDPATLRQARAIFAPQQALGARQAELGSRQAALGARQGALGAEQGRLGARQANATPGRAAELGRQQAALGRRQDVLGAEQEALGRQQAALGREQSRLSREADAKFLKLIAEAIRRGLALRVN